MNGNPDPIESYVKIPHKFSVRPSHHIKGIAFSLLYLYCYTLPITVESQIPDVSMDKLILKLFFRAMN